MAYNVWLSRHNTHSNMQVIRVAWCVRIACYLALFLVAVGFITISTVELFSRWRSSRGGRSLWVTKSKEDGSFILKSSVITESKKYDYNFYTKFTHDNIPFSSAYMIPKGEDTSGTVYTKKLPTGNDVAYKKIGFFDPLQENQFFLTTNFTGCQYSKCKMTGAKESADAMIFLVAKLKNADIPQFKRSPSQYWVMKSDEAPSRFSWFESLRRPGVRETMNWTLTHKSDSDIPVVYGKLTEKEGKDVIEEEKDYSQIYDGKTKVAAWFVSHCPVRSRRGLYVEQMASRIDVDIFGNCGTKKCGMAEKLPGVFGKRQLDDKDTCFPMMSANHFFYLAFENSLCQEYMTEKFFKIFHEVDVVPVVRGGADYKQYFPPNTFVDASDFSTPEMLADFLLDLASDKDRYVNYLKNKNRYKYVLDFPEWQCKLCEKLHTDRSKKTYDNIHTWWTQDSCHDAMDSVVFY